MELLSISDKFIWQEKPVTDGTKTCQRCSEVHFTVPGHCMANWILHRAPKKGVQMQ